MNSAQNAIGEAGFFIEGEVKESIAGHRVEKRSVDTGRFLNSIATEHRGLRADVGTKVPYSVYLEYGTIDIAPRMHFRNSLARNKNKIKDFVKKAIEET